MNRITHFNTILEENFNNYLKKYFYDLNYCNKYSSFSNYFNFINDLDSFSDSFIKYVIKNYSEYIDECFFNSSYRKNIGKKRIKDSKHVDRYKLVNSYVCASIDDNLLFDTVNYIYNTYDTDYIKEIVFMSDCAKWIKQIPKSHWFNFTSNTKVE